MANLLAFLYFTMLLINVNSETEEDHGVKYANKCEGEHFFPD